MLDFGVSSHPSISSVFKGAMCSLWEEPDLIAAYANATLEKMEAAYAQQKSRHSSSRAVSLSDDNNETTF